MSGSTGMFSESPQKCFHPSPHPPQGQQGACSRDGLPGCRKGVLAPWTCLCGKPNDEGARSHVSETGTRKEEPRVREVCKKIRSWHAFSEAQNGGLAVNLHYSGSLQAEHAYKGESVRLS